MAAAVMARWDATEDGEALPRSRVATPSGYDSVDEFLSEMRQRYEEGVCADEHNVTAGKEDAKFVAGNQWDPAVEEKRKRQKKPILTVNRLIAFIAQIVGNRLMNETEIRVNPDKAGTKEIATIREGIIRSIYKNSQAVFARDEAHKYQVIGGQGAFYLSIEYAGDDVFEQKICLKNIADPYAAVFDPMGVDPTGGDCDWGFVGEDIPIKTFKNRWPWAATVSFDDNGRWNQSGHWLTGENVRIVSYWRMVTEGTKTLALFQDGTDARCDRQGRIRVSEFGCAALGWHPLYSGRAQSLRAALHRFRQCFARRALRLSDFVNSDLSRQRMGSE
jgi:hypothetical protein